MIKVYKKIREIDIGKISSIDSLLCGFECKLVNLYGSEILQWVVKLNGEGIEGYVRLDGERVSPLSWWLEDNREEVLRVFDSISNLLSVKIHELYVDLSNHDRICTMERNIDKEIIGILSVTSDGTFKEMENEEWEN